MNILATLSASAYYQGVQKNISFLTLSFEPFIPVQSRDRRLALFDMPKGWLAIAKLKPLVDRYSCQPIRSPDTSNNLSVGPSCM